MPRECRISDILHNVINSLYSENFLCAMFRDARDEAVKILEYWESYDNNPENVILLYKIYFLNDILYFFYTINFCYITSYY